MSQLDRRWRNFGDLVEQAVRHDNIIGLGGATVLSVRHALPGGDPAEGFRIWAEQVFRQTVLERDGSWLRPYFDQAAQLAANRARDLTHMQVLTRKSRTDMTASSAVSELRGIGAVVIQQCVREVAKAVRTKTRPAKLARTLRDRIRKVGMARSHAMASFEVVTAFSLATLDALRAAGVTHVGTVPERVKRPVVVRDALDDEVEVLTAGDDNVCPICEDLSDEGPYPIDEADDLIPAHPECRCAFVPASDRRFANVRE